MARLDLGLRESRLCLALAQLLPIAELARGQVRSRRHPAVEKIPVPDSLGADDAGPDRLKQHLGRQADRPTGGCRFWVMHRHPVSDD